MLHQGALDQKLAEYCTAAAASLAFSPHGAVFHVCGGVSVRAREFCNALWPRHVRCMLSSSPRMDIWMTCARTACRSGWGRQALSTAWQRSCERFSMLPWTCRFMGVSTCTQNMPRKHSFIHSRGHAHLHAHAHTYPVNANQKAHMPHHAEPSAHSSCIRVHADVRCMSAWPKLRRTTRGCWGRSWRPRLFWAPCDDTATTRPF